jgi:hypothetical protein
MQIRNYSSVENIWNPQAQRLLGHRVYVQEKLDGSQFAFSRDGARSKRCHLDPLNPPDLFQPAMSWLFAQDLPWDLVFYGEAIARPKHNALTYGRAPGQGFVVFDIEQWNPNGQQWEWVYPEICQSICERLGMPYVVPFCRDLVIESWDSLKEFLGRESMLGGPIEGVVVKPYDRAGLLCPHSGRPILVKVVREEFRERNEMNQRKLKSSQTASGLLDQLLDAYQCDARFEKAVQRLRDEGKI